MSNDYEWDNIVDDQEHLNGSKDSVAHVTDRKGFCFGKWCSFNWPCQKPVLKPNMLFACQASLSRRMSENKHGVAITVSHLDISYWCNKSVGGSKMIYQSEQLLFFSHTLNQRGLDFCSQKQKMQILSQFTHSHVITTSIFADQKKKKKF